MSVCDHKGACWNCGGPILVEEIRAEVAAAEREACAKLAESHGEWARGGPPDEDIGRHLSTAEEISQAIRARGEPGVRVYLKPGVLTRLMVEAGPGVSVSVEGGCQNQGTKGEHDCWDLGCGHCEPQRDLDDPNPRVEALMAPKCQTCSGRGEVAFTPSRGGQQIKSRPCPDCAPKPDPLAKALDTFPDLGSPESEPDTEIDGQPIHVNRPLIPFDVFDRLKSARDEALDDLQAALLSRGDAIKAFNEVSSDILRSRELAMKALRRIEQYAVEYHNGVLLGDAREAIASLEGKK